MEPQDNPYTPPKPVEPKPGAGGDVYGSPPDGRYIVEENKDARQWGMLAHLSALAGYIGVPFGNIVGPLVVWMIKKEEFPFVDEQGKEALNYQISWTIWLVVATLSIFIFVGILLLPVAAICHIVFMIMAAVKANNGEAYQCPLTIRFIK